MSSSTVLTRLDDFATLLALSDVVLLVSGTEFQAHKAILSGHSPVFRAMFQHDLINSEHARVIIIDDNPEAFQLVLVYIYSGKIDSLAIEKYLEELLTAADKYQLIGLKTYLEDYLCSKVTRLSSVTLILLANSYNLSKLKTALLESTLKYE